MICPVIHPEPCPDLEACSTGWPCERVLALQEEHIAVDSYTQFYSYEVNKGQIEIVPTPDGE
jgi:hypothetical protein